MVNIKNEHADKTSVIGQSVTQTNECLAHRFQPSTSRDSRDRPQASQTSRPRRNDGNQEATSRNLLAKMHRARAARGTVPKPNHSLEVKGE